MSNKVIYLISFVLVLGFILTSTANAADVTPQLYVTFDGSLSGSTYIAGAGEIVNGTLSLKNGTEVLYGGILTTAGGQEGLHFMPTDSLASKNAINEDIITTSFVIEGAAKRNAPSAGFQTFFCVYGSVGYRYLSGNPTDTQYWTHGPTSTGWAVVSGDGQPVSDTDMVHYALVYEYVSDTECKLSYYVDAVQFGDTLINTTAAGGESSRGMMFAGDPHPSATDRGMPLDVDTIAFSTFTGTFNPETDFILPGGPGALAPASNPKPRDGAMLEATWTNLSWRAGDFAVSHDVYIGDNFDDVNEGAEGTFAGNQATTSLIVGFTGFPVPGGLVPGTTYYWRIDEVNEADPNSPWKGPVWSFWIQPNKAYDPVPADGLKYVLPDVTLNWTPGLGAKLHYVYFGDNFDDVNSADMALPQADTTYTPGTLELDKTYYWRVDESDGITMQKGDVWSFTIARAGGGLKAEYFNNTTLSGEPVLTRLDPEIDFNWGNAEVAGENSPDASINVNNFSARWSGDLEVDLTDIYTFHINANNGFRLSLDGQIIIDFWDNPTTSSRKSEQIELIGGDIYSIRMEYFESEDTAIAQLFWESSTREQQIIPSGALQLPLKAGSPNPYKNAVDVKQTPILSWSPGDYAAAHQLYFGTDEEAVRNATTVSDEYRATKNLGSESYDPGKLAWHTTYYWRVDEVNNLNPDSPWVGNVWSFTVADFIEIDGIEDYNDYPPDEIFSTWIDGWEVPENGSMAGHADPPFAETDNVHGGRQSMPVYYENNFKYSEATLTLVSARDWTEEGVGALSLWFYGDTANAAERMYVNLNGIATVYHDNPDAALIDTWTEWAIDLQKFAAQGVNLANVNTISIGFGDKNNLQAGGSGMVFFDDIRLYRPAPEPEPAP